MHNVRQMCAPLFVSGTKTFWQVESEFSEDLNDTHARTHARSAISFAQNVNAPTAISC